MDFCHSCNLAIKQLVTQQCVGRWISHILGKEKGVCLVMCNFCDPMDCSSPASSVYGILQVRILEWVSMLSSRESSQPRDQTCVSYVSCIGRRILYHCTIWEESGSKSPWAYWSEKPRGEWPFTIYYHDTRCGLRRKKRDFLSQLGNSKGVWKKDNNKK